MRCILLFLFMLLSIDVFANPKPLYEIGGFAARFTSPHYPGSDQMRSRDFIAPYAILRGKYLKADDNGVRGEFFENKNLILDMSFAAAFPSDSFENYARDGMPNLDWIGEVGPRLRYLFIPPDNPIHDFELGLQLRAVFSTNLNNIVHRGYVFHPIITYHRKQLVYGYVQLYFRAGAIWGTEEIMDYFYEVDPSYVTARRKRFNAKGGFLETHTDVAMDIDVTKRFAIILGVQRNNYHGATNENSYLMRKKQTESYAVGIIWNLYKSDEMSNYR